jgi:hypothetical protein
METSAATRLVTSGPGGRHPESYPRAGDFLGARRDQGAAVRRPTPILQNEPNFARPGGKCAKQTQIWRYWGIWASAVMWTVVRPPSETCKTNSIWAARTWCARTGCQVRKVLHAAL